MKVFLKILFSGLLYYSGLLHLYLFLRDNLFGSEKVRMLLYHRVLDLQKEKAFCSLPGIIVSVKTFDQQMEYLSKNYNVISLESLVDSLKNNLPFPKKGVVITFDDGWKDNFSFALPILKRYDLPATIFLTSGYIGTDKNFWPEQVIFILKSEKNLKEKLKNLSGEIYSPAIQDCLDDLIQEQEISLPPSHPNPAMHFASLNLPQGERELHKFSPPLMGGSKGEGDTLRYKKPYLDVLTDLIERLKYLPPLKRELIIDDLRKRMGPTEESFSDDHSMLNWGEIESLEKNHISFGSHSVNHTILTQLDETEAKEEIIHSKKEIEKKLSKPVLAFAYPNGDFNDSVRDLVKEAGYLCALTLGSGLNDKRADIFSLSRRNIHKSMSTGLRGKFSKALFACQINGIFDLL